VFVSHLAINIITRTQGANIEGSDPRGYTPLHLAAMEGHSVVCQLLLGYSAPIEARDKVRVHLRACVCLIASRGLGAISRSYSGRKRPPPPPTHTIAQELHSLAHTILPHRTATRLLSWPARGGITPQWTALSTGVLTSTQSTTDSEQHSCARVKWASRRRSSCL
jgi:hypothetical protein